MIKIGLLEDEDTIHGTDYIRPLEFLYESWGNELRTFSEFSGQPLNHLGWVLAQDVCPAWVGHTVEYANRVSTVKYEFVRGNIPSTHLEKY